MACGRYPRRKGDGSAGVRRHMAAYVAGARAAQAPGRDFSQNSRATAAPARSTPRRTCAHPLSALRTAHHTALKTTVIAVPPWASIAVCAYIRHSRAYRTATVWPAARLSHAPSFSAVPTDPVCALEDDLSLCSARGDILLLLYMRSFSVGRSVEAGSLAWFHMLSDVVNRAGQVADAWRSGCSFFFAGVGTLLFP